MSDMTPDELEKRLENLRPPDPSALDGRVQRLLCGAAVAEPRAGFGRLTVYSLAAAGIVVGVALVLLIQAGQRWMRLSPAVPIRISAIRGEVLVKHAGSATWEEMGASSQLRLGDQLWSGSASGINLELKDSSLIALNAGSVLSLTQYNGRVEFELTHGTMRAVLRDGHPPFFVHTPQGLLESLGTEFTVSVE